MYSDRAISLMASGLVEAAIKQVPMGEGELTSTGFGLFRR